MIPIAIAIIVLFGAAFIYGSVKYKKTIKKPIERYENAFVLSKDVEKHRKKSGSGMFIYYEHHYYITFRINNDETTRLFVKEDVFNNIFEGQTGTLLKHDYIFSAFIVPQENTVV